MKKYFYLLMLAMMPMCFAACGSDDDEPTGVAGVETLYGTWQQTHGVAFEDGAFHHDNDVSADKAEYLYFDQDGTCVVLAGGHGVLSFSSSGTYSFNFDQESKSLRIGSWSLVVDVLSGGMLKLKYYYSPSPDEYILATYKKVSDSIWDNLLN
ncbi:MAG: hypothetical protein IJ551_02675 [Prevotella sp.]|nr:hypothetical protein [Prevotella sp.]